MSDTTDTTVKPLSPGLNVKTSATTTPCAVDGPLLRYEKT